MLSSSEIEDYRRDGYVTPEFRLSADWIEAIRGAHDRLVFDRPEFADYCSAVLAFDTWFLNVARIPEIVEMVCDVLGDDVALWNSSFFAKPPRVGTRPPWPCLFSTASPTP